MNYPGIEELLQQDDNDPQNFKYGNYLVKENKGAKCYAEIFKTIKRYKEANYVYSLYIMSKNETIKIISIPSNILSINFMVGLIQYYDAIINEALENTINFSKLSNLVRKMPNAIKNNILIETGEVAYCNNDKSEKFIEKNKNEIFTENMIREYLILTSSLYKTKELSNLIKQHCKDYSKDGLYVSGGKAIIEYYKYVYPGFMELSLDEFNKTIIMSFGYYDYKNIDTIKLACKIICINDDMPVDVSDDTKIKDLSTEDKELAFDLNNNRPRIMNHMLYVIESVKIVNYINELTLKEYRELLNYLEIKGIYTKAANAFIKVAEDAKIDVGKTANMEKANKALLDHVENKEYVKTKKFYKYRGDYSSDYYFIKVFTEYFESLGDKKLSNSEVDVLYAVMNYRNSWITEAKMADWLAKKLYKNSDAVTIVEVLKEVSTQKLSLTPLTWGKYADNYSDYKDMPLSWVLEML